MAIGNPTPGFSNPGPRWGYRALVCFDKILPQPVFRAGLAAGTLIAMLAMVRQRRHSSEYWLALTGKSPSFAEQFRHFHAFAQALVRKLTAPHNPLPRFVFAQGAFQDEFERLCASGRPGLFGTFHVGYSDMLGCLLSNFGRHVSLVRLRVGNSLDTDILESLFKGLVRFIWINQPEDFLFSLKAAIERGESIGLQCDRVEFGTRLAPFDFLGRHRLFPTTIYHLSALFKLPVVFSFTVGTNSAGEVEVYTSQVFEPHPDRKRTLEDGQRHFQAVLDALQSNLRVHPQMWFNFIPLNPTVDARA